MDEVEDENGIVGQLAYVAAHPADFSKEDMVNVMRAALAVTFGVADGGRCA